MGPHGKGGETWRVSGCLVQDIISSLLRIHRGAGRALDYQRQPQERHRALRQLSPGPLCHALVPAL